MKKLNFLREDFWSIQNETNAQTYLMLFCFLVGLTCSAQMVSTLVETFPGNDGISIDANGNIFVNSNGANGILTGTSVHKVTPNGDVSLFTNNLSVFPSGSIFDNSGNLLVTGWSTGTITRIDPAGGTNTTILVAGISGAGGLEMDSAGNVYCVEYNFHRVLKFDSNGNNPTAFSTGGPILNPSGLTYVEATGKFYVGNWNNGVISEIPANGGAATAIATLPTGNVGTITHYGGYLFVTSPEHDIIYSVHIASQSVEVFAGTGTQGNLDGDISVATFNSPIGLGTTDGETFYISELNPSGSGRLRVIEGVSLDYDDFQNNKKDIRLFPNPTQNILNVRLNSQNLNLINAFVFDVHGRKIAIQSPKIQAKYLELDISHLSSGIYFLQIDSTISNFSETQTFIKD